MGEVSRDTNDGAKRPRVESCRSLVGEGRVYLPSRVHPEDKASEIPYQPPSPGLMAQVVAIDRCRADVTDYLAGDGIALTSMSHPEGSILAAELGEEAEEMNTERPNECAPAADALVGSLHWVRLDPEEMPRTSSSEGWGLFNLNPKVWEWRGDGRWSHDGVGDFASCAYKVGFRYLCPAEYPATAMTDNSRAHPYHGPTAPDPANPKQRISIPDAVHEQFHRAIGDVAAGKVPPEARRQMQEALKGAPKDKPAFPIPREDDRRRIGFRNRSTTP